MFIYYYLHVDHPFGEVETELLRMLPGLRGWAEDAYREGEHLNARIGSRPGRIAKSIAMTVGDPVRGTSETWIPVEWEATGTPGLFPLMHADIIVAAVTPALTQISLRGTYRVPLGTLGRAIDRVLLHRLAEASVKGFMDRLAGAIAPSQLVEGKVPAGGGRTAPVG